MKYAMMALMLVSCLVFQGCVRHHHPRPDDNYSETHVIHHHDGPAPGRHDVRPHHPAPKPHMDHAKPHYKPKAHKPKPHHAYSGNHNKGDRHFGQPRHKK